MTNKFKIILYYSIEFHQFKHVVIIFRYIILDILLISYWSKQSIIETDSIMLYNEYHNIVPYMFIYLSRDTKVNAINKKINKSMI